MEIYGLIGKKLTHSFSPDYFSKKFSNLKLNAEYCLYEMEDISGFMEVLRNNPGLIGLNVTIPYKKEVIPFLDEIDAVADDLGAVNTIKIYHKNGRRFLKGFNTDVVGFEQAIHPFVEGREKLTALILGTGGSAQAVAYVLNKLAINYHFVSRTAGGDNFFSYKNLSQEIMLQHKLIVNTTPIGMFPLIEDAPPIPYDFISKNHILFDLIYNPSETQFLRKGKNQGAIISGGIRMLEIQAEASWKIWNSTKY